MEAALLFTGGMCAGVLAVLAVAIGFTLHGRRKRAAAEEAYVRDSYVPEPRDSVMPAGPITTGGATKREGVH